MLMEILVDRPFHPVKVGARCLLPHLHDWKAKKNGLERVCKFLEFSKGHLAAGPDTSKVL
jgi:hypothetical protein